MKKFSSLIPIFLFLFLYLGIGIINQNFYSISVPFLLIISIAWGLFQNPQPLFSQKIHIFLTGVGQKNVLMMCFIFLLAGAFSSLSGALGSIGTLVNYGLSIFPSSIFLVLVFILSCLISLSMGTSMGTIATLGPIAISLADTSQLPLALSIGAVVSGAMFGDNLSVISDTTLVITQSVECSGREKLLTNLRYVWLPAIICCVIYHHLAMDFNIEKLPSLQGSSFIFALPYVIVIFLSLWGTHVLLSLSVGLLLNILLAFWEGYSFFQIMEVLDKGFFNMSDMIIITLLIGGLIGLLQANGGINWLLFQGLKRIQHSHWAEKVMVFLVAIVNVCVANNTISLMITGPIAGRIKKEYQLSAPRVASLLDMSSCAVQGLLPYGLQILTAAKLAEISPMEIVPYVYYPMILGITVLLIIFFNPPKVNVKKPEPVVNDQVL